MRNEKKLAMLAGILACALAGAAGCLQDSDDAGVNDKTSAPAVSPTPQETTDSPTLFKEPTHSPTPPEESTDEATPEPETTEPETTEQETTEPESTAEEPAPPDDAPATGAFGDTVTYDDGISVTVAPPVEFSPSGTAAFEESPSYVRFSITVVNDGDQALDLTFFTNSAQSGQSEASEVFDSEQGLEGPPYTSLQPGRSVTWDSGFGVEDPNDIVLQLSPSWDHEEAVFTSN
ncbi:hypothetical protein [Glycomyces sp. YM15]|uniref:hypothetical protein n=1 Tax=Glycomyces sp. YM15 TaxID=2800446 RepID=UPI001965E640|nr:hypothetical protein [Glycomyces sp. YM15]